MNAGKLGRRCPLCREETSAGSCMCGRLLKIVLLQIDEWTPEEAVQNVQAALVRAAREIARYQVN